MVWKPVHISDHALDRLVDRNIRRTHLQWLLARGKRGPATKVPYRGELRWEVRGYLGRHEAAVVFIEFRTFLLVVTVEWIQTAAETAREARRLAKKKGNRKRKK